MHDKEKTELRHLFHFTHGNYLVACSGGIDSCVLAHLLYENKITFALAHYNYRLRTDESDGDQEFVKQLAKKYKVPFYTITQPLTKQQGTSVQMQAREMRYSWLQQLIKDNKFTHLVTAHHANDQAETLLLNLFRGSGLKGMAGMKMVNKNHLRPLLALTKGEIETYARKNKLKWRSDSSNSNNKYDRNYIRNVIIPAIEKRWPGAVERITENTFNLQRENELFQYLATKEMSLFIEQKNNRTHIHLSALAKHKQSETLLYNYLSGSGFNFTQCTALLKVARTTETKEFHSPTHTIEIKGKQCVLLEKENGPLKQPVMLAKSVKKIAHPLNLEFKHVVKKPAIPVTPTVACMDAGHITWPLTLRLWQAGDWFKPLGMKGKKKISDLLTDKKMTAYQKQNTWVLCDAEKIIWVPGIRLDDRVKITPKTVKYLTIKLK